MVILGRVESMNGKRQYGNDEEGAKILLRYTMDRYLPGTLVFVLLLMLLLWKEFLPLIGITYSNYKLR